MDARRVPDRLFETGVETVHAERERERERERTITGSAKTIA
jgi:hypothetical protein